MQRYPYLKAEIPINGRPLLAAEKTTLYLHGIKFDPDMIVRPYVHSWQGVVGYQWKNLFILYNPDKIHV
jgi:hypothetical protein